MKKKLKKASLMLFALSMITVSCAQNVDPTILALVQEPAIAKDPSKGSLSGSVELLQQSGTTQSNDSIRKAITIKVIRDEDILDASDTKKVIEAKGKTIATGVLNEYGQFFIPDLLPGNVSVFVSGAGLSATEKIKVEKGKVNLVSNIVLGLQDQRNGKTIDLNISGKVVKPDGTPVPNAKVADITGGFVSASTVTGQDGTFIMKVNPFTSPKNLEISSPDGKQVTTYAVQPDNINDLAIPLLANTRPVTGRIVDSVTRKPVEGVSIQVSETQVSTVTDSKGLFTLKGVPTTPIGLSIGSLKGYIDKKVGVPESANSAEQKLDDITLTPLGNIQVNVQADNDLIPQDYLPDQRAKLPSLGSSGLDTRNDVMSLDCPQNGGATVQPTKYYYSNSNVIREELVGKIQLEGTDIVRDFAYPPTPTMNPRPQCAVSALISFDLTVYLNNYVYAIPIENVPGGEYTLSVTLPGHEVQKGIKVMVPSRDTISTEIIQIRRAKKVFGVGDIRGKVVIKDSDGNVVSPSGLKIRVIATNSDLDLRVPTAEKLDGETNNNTEIRSGTQEALINAITNPDAGINTNKDGQTIGVPHRYAYADSDGSYLITNAASGTRIVVAAVVREDGDIDKLDENYQISSYVLLNVVPNTENKAGDMIINKRYKSPEPQPTPR